MCPGNLLSWIYRHPAGLTLFTSNVYINENVLMKSELKIESWGKQNRNFDLEAILGKVAILTSMLKIEHALVKYL